MLTTLRRIKVLTAVSLFGIFCSITLHIAHNVLEPNRMLAQADTLPELLPSNFTQLGLAGLSLFVLWYVICKTMPDLMTKIAKNAEDAVARVAEHHKEAIEELAAKMEQMNRDNREALQEVHEHNRKTYEAFASKVEVLIKEIGSKLNVS